MSLRWPPLSKSNEQIDALMAVLAGRGVSQVAWVTMSERRMSGEQPRCALANDAVREERGRWPQLVVLDWDAASDASEQDRWYSDGVHLTTTGQAEFALWLRDEVLSIADPSWVNSGDLQHFVPLTPRRMLDTRSGLGAAEANLIVDVVGVLRAGAGFVPQVPQRVVDTRRVERVGKIEGTGGPLEIQVANNMAIDGKRVIAASFNLTVVDTEANDFGGFATVYPCGTRPDVSNLNFTNLTTVAGGVVSPVDKNGHVCVYLCGTAHVLVDVNGLITS